MHMNKNKQSIEVVTVDESRRRLEHDREGCTGREILSGVARWHMAALQVRPTGWTELQMPSAFRAC